jgi:hypothetical protein
LAHGVIDFDDDDDDDVSSSDNSDSAAATKSWPTTNLFSIGRRGGFVRHLHEIVILASTPPDQLFNLDYMYCIVLNDQCFEKS